MANKIQSREEVDEDYKPRKTIGRKKFENVYTYLVTEKSCTLANSMTTSMR